MSYRNVPTTCKVAILAVCCIFQARLLLAQTSAATDLSETRKQELLDLEHRWLRVADDPSALESILAPDFLHVLPAGIVTRDEQLEFMRKHPVPQASVQKHFENLQVRVYGNVEIVNDVVLAVMTGGTRRTLFTDVF